MVFNSGDFKNGISFSFRIPPDPPKGASEGGGLEGELRPIHHKRSCDVIYINSWVINSEDFKSETSFPIRIPSDPPKGVLGGGWRAAGTYTQQKMMR